MNRLKILSLLFFFSFITSSALAQVHARGYEGSSAVDLITNALVENAESAGLDCNLDYDILSKQLLSLINSKKLLKASSNKAVKSFLKLFNIKSVPQLFKDAADEAVFLYCEADDSGDDPYEDPEEE